MKFLLSFYGSFVAIAVGLVLMSGSMEMFSYLIFFCLIYAAIGSVAWLFIRKLMQPTSVYKIAFQLLLGLLVLNLLLYQLASEAPSLVLIGLGNKYSNFWVSLCLHVVYVSSFLIASLPGLRNLQPRKR